LRDKKLSGDDLKEGFTSEELMNLRTDYKKNRGEFIDLRDEFISIVTDEKLAESD